MPTYNFTKRIRNVDEIQYTAQVTVPSGISTVKVTVLLDATDMLNPDTLFRYGFEWRENNQDTWKFLAGGEFVGNPDNDTSLPPYIQFTSLSNVVGKRLRGYLFSHTQISLGAAIEIN
jgi:hypothetical protein